MKALKILIVVFCIGCNSNQQNNHQVNVESSAKKVVDQELDSLRNPSHFAYLSDLPSEQIASLILKDSLHPRDNEVTFRCMDSLTSKNAVSRKFYFPVFIKIMNKADGALAEAVGDCVVNYVEHYTKEFLQQNMNKNDFDGFASTAGYEMGYESNGEIKNAEKWANSIITKCTSCDSVEIAKLKEFNKLVLKYTKENIEAN